MITNNAGYFLRQLEISEKHERLFSQWLQGRGWKIASMGDKLSAYDLKVVKNGKEMTFEIKYNSAVEKYKTVFVETRQSGKPSGLEVSTADYQIHFDETGKCKGWETKDLIKYIKDNKIKLSSTRMMTKSGEISGQGHRVPFDDFPLTFNVFSYL